ncbi:MAG TPA: heavy metal sensor histidine kinase [Blastocatellia bacterium]|nr:heavy metal sensor histidine kinase [Blastocatellia bacterium]
MNTRSIRFRLTVWYAGLLALLTLLFGASTWVGLRHYLNQSLNESLGRQARQIGESFLADVVTGGEGYVVSEINEHYAPELNNRFVRVTRANGSVLYVSGRPKESHFDPSAVSLPGAPVNQDFVREEHLPGSDLMIYTHPFTERTGQRFLIEVGAPDEQVEAVLYGLLLALALGLPLTLIVAISGGWLLLRQALNPVDEITRGAELITSRNLSQRLPVARTGDELERLSAALNRMIARLEESFQYIRRFTADASHELRTPLTVLRGELEAAAQKPQLNPEVGETIGSALEETERLSRIVESLLAISRLDAGEAQMEWVRFDLAELAAGTTEQMRLLAEDRNITLGCEAGGKVEIEGDRARLRQVVVNLVDNATRYTPAGGRVTVKVGMMDGNAVLEVEDNGVGIPAEALPHIFERFYRADKARSRQMGGTGLGLAIVKSIVTAHGGQVTVESTEGGGSRFRVELPRGRRPHDGETAPHQINKG